MITLTQRAEQHLIVLQTLDRGELLMAGAAALLGLSTRQIRRLRRAYRRHGPKALVHGNRGRPSPSASRPPPGRGSSISPRLPTPGSTTRTSASSWPTVKGSCCPNPPSIVFSARQGSYRPKVSPSPCTAITTASSTGPPNAR